MMTLIKSKINTIHTKLYFCASACAVPRPMISFIKEHYAKKLIGCEIGVAEGVNAESILQTLNVEKLFLVDPYTPYLEFNKVCDMNTSTFLKVQERLKHFKDKTVFIRKTSKEAINDLSDNLDFVYIDGCHEYESVKEDIKSYYPKIVADGVLGGHDFGNIHKGVKKAVLEFAGKNLFTYKVDWWIIKSARASL